MGVVYRAVCCGLKSSEGLYVVTRLLCCGVVYCMLVHGCEWKAQCRGVEEGLFCEWSGVEVGMQR